MKKFTPLYLLCFIFLFISCSEDDSTEEENRNANKELIIGKWEFTQMVWDDGTEREYECDEAPHSLNFYNNGEVVRQYCGNGDAEGEYLITGDILELEHEGAYSGTVRMRAEIESINSGEMVLDVEEGYVHGGAITIYLEKAN
ncbi:hypothetical protein [Salegentibacter sediminis]|uniref:hypothetical protein n=1 Tax=Salegentibacter sediminis TaxID=1930251 RepID=UPI0009C0B4D3|nr:hypothetical protein [Salegentibacter sediminis]